MNLRPDGDHVDIDAVIEQLKEYGYRIIEPEPESFKRIVNGREAVRVRSEL